MIVRFVLILSDQVPLVGLRSHTSKLVSLSNLSALKSFGFRGEAVSCIAAVSYLSLFSRHEDYACTTWTGIVGGKRICSPNCAIMQLPSHGTLVKVDKLFFNQPVRRLDKTTIGPQELKKIYEYILRIAIGCNNVEITVKDHKGNRLLSFSGLDEMSCINAVYGQDVVLNLATYERNSSGFTIRGLFSPEPNSTKSTQFVGV